MLSLATVVALAMLLAVGPAEASPGPVGYTTRTIATQDQLWTLDVQTGTGTFVAATGLSPLTNLALSGNSTLYGVNTTTASLYTINPATASPTLIGPLGVTISGSSNQFTATGGSLWLLRGSPTSLYQVNPSTGQATLVGPIGQGLVTGIAGTCSGHLFAYSSTNATLLRIDPASGAGSVIGPTGLPGGGAAAVRLAFDDSEHLWGDVFVSGSDKTYRFDMHGTATFVADTGANNNTLALPHPCHH